jgi:uncharacterized membrane protein
MRNISKIVVNMSFRNLFKKSLNKKLLTWNSIASLINLTLHILLSVY